VLADVEAGAIQSGLRHVGNVAKEGSEPIRLGLGLQKLNYRDWAANKGFLTWDQLGKGETSLEKLNDALRLADELHFNTEGLISEQILLSRKINPFGEPAAGWTNYELTMIKNSYSSKVFWWYDMVQDQSLSPLLQPGIR
jgi:hypothetical protein